MIYLRIKEQCKKQGISINTLEKELGFAKGSLCKIDTHKPSADKIQKIADYLNTTSDYLLYGNDLKFERPNVNVEAGYSMQTIIQSIAKLSFLQVLKDFPEEEMKNLEDFAKFRKQMYEETHKNDKKKKDK